MRILGELFTRGAGDYSVGGLLKRKDSLYKMYQEWMKERPLQLNSYTLIAYSAILSPKVLEDMFEWRRNYPKILKMITFGRQDSIFEVYLLNEMAHYYAYGAGRLPEDYNKKISERYTAITNCQVANVQERFVYSVPKVGHSLHVKRKKQLQNLMNLYLGLVLSDYPESPSL